MKAHIQYSPWTNQYIATLLGGEFSNCHGYGKTQAEAMISLRINRKILRLKQNKERLTLDKLKNECKL